MTHRECRSCLAGKKDRLSRSSLRTCFEYVGSRHEPHVRKGEDVRLETMARCSSACDFAKKPKRPPLRTAPLLVGRRDAGSCARYDPAAFAPCPPRSSKEAGSTLSFCLTSEAPAPREDAAAHFFSVLGDGAHASLAPVGERESSPKASEGEGVVWRVDCPSLQGPTMRT